MSTSDTQKQPNDSVKEIGEQFLLKANDYFQSELKLVSNDYDCLTTMNITALDKYKQMDRTLQRVNNSIRSINDSNCTNISSVHTQLKEIEDGMSNLESTLKHLDTYSCLLENQVNKISLTTQTKSSRNE